MGQAARNWWKTPGGFVRLLAIAVLALSGNRYLEAITTGFVAAWIDADPYGGEIGPAQRADHRAAVRQAAIETSNLAHHLLHQAIALAVLGLVLAACAEWRSRDQPRRFPWRSLSALALLAGAWRLDPVFASFKLAFVLLAFAYAALDVRRRRPGPWRAIPSLLLVAAVVECAVQFGPWLAHRLR